MFDPTAFDNMKVVIEGALYDKDLSGDIVITDRNDIINLAKMSRLFNIFFSLSETAGSQVTAKIEMESKLVNLAAELLPGSPLDEHAGCIVRLQFFLKHADDDRVYQEIESILLDVWGDRRRISQTVEYNPLNKSSIIHNMITIDFARLISEEQMEDLVEMTALSAATLKKLQDFLM